MRFTDRRHPIRATVALIVVVGFAAVVLTAAIAVAVGFVVFAFRQAVG